MANYSPANWEIMTRDPLRAYTWICPTVGALATLYGSNCPAMWTDLQVTGLFLGSASTDAASASSQAVTFAAAFAASVAGYKLTEVMLFFARYKAGVYGRNFAAFDTRAVGQAFHHEFVRERLREMAQAEELAASRRAELDRRTRAAHAVSRERYHAAPPETRYVLQLRTNPAADAARLADLWTRLGADPATLPTRDGAYLLETDKVGMARLAALDDRRLFTVDDSWEAAPDTAKLQP